MEGALREPLLPASFPSGLAWYVGYTHAMREQRAAREIQRLGVNVYLPLRTLWIRHARKKEKETRPLFPRYLFVQFDINFGFAHIQRADGVSHILKHSDIPSQVDGKLVELIRHEEDMGSYDETTGGLEGVSPGDQVRIVDAGGFDDQVAEFKRADSKRRVEVLLSILGRQARVILDIAKIRKI